MTLFLFITPFLVFSGGLVQGLPHKAVLLEDHSYQGKVLVQVIEVEDSRGRISGADYETTLYLKGDRQARGRLFIRQQDQWIAMECYQRRDQKWRAYILKKMDDLLSFYCESGALARTLLLGWKNKEIQNLFRQCGLSFLLALSGMHIAIILQFFHYPSFLFPNSSRDFILFIILSVFLWLTGFRHSLFRALLMFFLRIFYRFKGTPLMPPDLILLSLVLHLILFPEAITDLSLQLSYSAMVGIYLITPQLNSLFRAWRMPFIKDGFCLSAGAQLAITPLLILYFGELHPLSLISSLFLTPLIALYIWLGLSLFLFPLNGYRLWAGQIMDRLENLIFGIGDFLGQIPPLSIGRNGDKRLLWITISLLPVLVFGYRYLKGVISPYGEKSQSKLRFSKRNQNTAGSDGIGATEALGAEFSD